MRPPQLHKHKLRTTVEGTMLLLLLHGVVNFPFRFRSKRTGKSGLSRTHMEIVVKFPLAL